MDSFFIKNKETGEVHFFDNAHDVALFMWGKFGDDFEFFIAKQVEVEAREITAFEQELNEYSKSHEPAQSMELLAEIARLKAENEVLADKAWKYDDLCR